MNSESLVSAVVDVLDSMNISYMLVGSFSSNLYGVPRATQDADFVLQVGAGVVSSVVQRLGPLFRLQQQIRFETITGTTRYIVDYIESESPFVIEFFVLSDDAHDQERFSRRRQMPLAGRNVFLPTPEDVIITKLRWSQQGQRPKDMQDLRSVIAVQGDRLDWEYIHHWAGIHGTRELLDKIRASIPPV